MQLDLKETESERPCVRLEVWGAFVACRTKKNCLVLFPERENTKRGHVLGKQ